MIVFSSFNVKNHHGNIFFVTDRKNINWSENCVLQTGYAATFTKESDFKLLQCPRFAKWCYDIIWIYNQNDTFLQINASRKWFSETGQHVYCSHLWYLYYLSASICSTLYDMIQCLRKTCDSLTWNQYGFQLKRWRYVPMKWERMHLQHIDRIIDRTIVYLYIDGLVQDCGISNLLSVETLQPCTKPTIKNTDRNW